MGKEESGGGEWRERVEGESGEMGREERTIST